MFYVYVIQSLNRKIYYGSTNDLVRRIKEHNSNKSYSTKGDTWELIYYEAYKHEADARVREKQLKYHGQAWFHLKNRIKNSISKN